MKILIKEKKIYIYLFFLSIAFVSGKWIYSYLLFPNEDIITKLLFEIYDYQYFPLIHSFGNLDFNPSYNSLDGTLKLIPMPYANLLFHSIFIKIFGYSGFILLEFLCIFFFLFIFFLIFKKINFSNLISLLLSAFIFALPSLTSLFDILNFPHLESMHLHDFYGLRVPRPIISNLYLFTFFYLLIQFYKEKISSNFLSLCFGLFLSLMWASVYYNFSMSAIALGIVLILNYKEQLFFNLKKNYKFILSIILYFIIFSTPFLIIFFLSESDYSTRVGLIDLNFDKKKILLEHIFRGIISKEFCLIFFLNSAALFYIKKRQNFYCHKSIEIFYILFVSSVLSPFLFIALSPVASEVHNFLNMIVFMSLICLFIFSIVIIANFFRTKIIEKKILNILVILFFIFFYNYQSILFAKKNNKQFFFRKDFSEINLALQKKDIKLSKEANILSFNDMIHTWWILSGYKNLSLINTSFTPITDEESENRMIHVFKYLKLNVDDFLIFFGNRKEGHRYFNKNVGDFLSHMKYQANSLTTFNDSKNFDEEIKNFILNTSPTVSQQTAIPKEEFERLKKKFLEVRNFNYKEPDLIIFKKDANVNIMKKIKVDSDKFCNLISNKTYAVYIKHSKIKNCKSID